MAVMGKMFGARTRAIGVCQACRTTVRADDDWTHLGIGVAHIECARYVSHQARRKPWQEKRRWWARLLPWRTA